MLALIERTLLKNGRLKAGDGVVVVAGQPIGQSGATNLLKLHGLHAVFSGKVSVRRSCNCVRLVGTVGIS